MTAIKKEKCPQCQAMMNYGVELDLKTVSCQMEGDRIKVCPSCKSRLEFFEALEIEAKRNEVDVIEYLEFLKWIYSS